MLTGPERSGALSRVNPIVPAVVVAAGLIVLLGGNRIVGAGLAIGALLAFANGVLLSGRVDFASQAGNIAGALLVMQAGLMVTFVIIGIATVILVKISVGLAVAAAVGFAITQLAILVTYYWTRGRKDAVVEGKAT